MESKQYSIGEFASINKVSARMLRHYDKIGLLRPVSVLPNGYRCYSEDQITAISKIKRLRDCDFLLEEIHEILSNDSPHFLAEAAKRKLAELLGQAAEQQNTIQSLQELARQPVPPTCTSIYGISLALREKVNLLVQNHPIFLEDVETAFDALYRLVQCKKLPSAGCAVLISRIDCGEAAQTKVGIPILIPYLDDNYETFTLPAASVLSVIHYGDYYTIGNAYSALLRYAGQNNCSISDLFLERYFLDSSHGVHPPDYVTEISVALKDAKTP